MNQRLWPDLLRHGWDLGIRRGPDGQPSGIFLERVRKDAEQLAVDACQAFGFSGAEDHGEAGWRLDAPITRFRFEEVNKWLPAFDSQQDLKPNPPRVVSSFYVESLYLASGSEFPMDADFSATDFQTALHAWELPQARYDALVQSRTLAVSGDATGADLVAQLRAVEGFSSLSVGVLGQVAESALAAMRKGAGLHVIRRVGDIEWSPALRFHAQGVEPGRQFADWQALIEGAEAQGLDRVLESEVSRKEKERIEDVGEKIGGARKDFYLKGLNVEDFRRMNDAERREYVRLTNIWPFSIKGRREVGARASVVAWLRDFRRKIDEPNFAKYHYSESTIEEFIETAGRLDKFFADVHDLNGLLKACADICVEIPDISSVIGFKAANMLSEDSTYDYQNFRHIPAGHPKGWSKWARFYDNPDLEAHLWERLLPSRQVKKEVDGDEKLIPQRPHLDSLIQDGLPDFRQGQDIPPEGLMTAFGFRGIEFGNWLPQDERQRVVNAAYDSLMAMAMTMNVAPSFMSLNGELALAFGSRGRSRAAAHYEPMRRVTNLTRMKGAGSLAHEYSHGLDDWLFRHSEHIPGRSRDQFYASEPAASAAAQGYRATSTLTCYGQMVNLMSLMQATPLGEQERLLSYRNKAETHRSFAQSWMRYPLRDALVASRNMSHEHAALEADAILNVMMDSAMAQYRTEDAMVGSLGEFESDRVAHSLIQAVQGKYGVTLPKKSRDQVELNLNSVSHNLGNVRILENPDLRERFGARMRVLTKQSDYSANAKRLDSKRSKKYWAEPTELMARAFESYIFDKLQEAGSQIDYLVHGVEPDRFADSGYIANPYPAGDERTAFNAEFDRLMDAIRQEFGIAPFSLPESPVQKATPAYAPMKLAASF